MIDPSLSKEKSSQVESFEDRVIGHVAGRPVYDNTATVVSVLLPHEDKLVVIRRGKDPGKDKIALPGGFQMYGETWKETAIREVYEETGRVISPYGLKIVSFDTDEFNNNLLVVRSWEASGFKGIDHIDKGEITQILNCGYRNLKDPEYWAFPRHFVAAMDYFNRHNNRMDNFLDGPFRTMRSYGYH